MTDLAIETDDQTEVTTWRKELAELMTLNGDPGPVIRASNEADMDVRFVHGFGSPNAPDVVIWTAGWVYYVHEYDGSQSLSWVPRNPPEGPTPEVL